MSWLLIFLAVFFALCGIAFTVIGKKTAVGAEVYKNEENKYKAVVLDVHREKISTAKTGKKKKAVILQFRDEVGKKTIIHKYTGMTWRRYNRGDTVELFFDEEKNTALIDGDNQYVILSKLLRICSVISYAVAVLSAITIVILCCLKIS